MNYSYFLEKIPKKATNDAKAYGHLQWKEAERGSQNRRETIHKTGQHKPKSSQI